MSRIRKVLVACTVEIAQKRRICSHNRAEHVILKGTACLVIRNPGTSGAKNYCPQCALAMLDQAASDLRDLRTALT